jgi:hypothetical protein
MNEVLAAIADLKKEIIELKTELLLIRFGVEQTERILEEFKNQQQDQSQPYDSNYKVENL